MMKKKRLGGLIIVSVAEITIGIYGLFLTLNIIISFSKIAKNLTPYWADQFYGTIPISIVTLCGALSIISLGIFLLKKKQIIRMLHIILSPLIAIIIVNILGRFVVQLISHLNIPILLSLNELLIAIIIVTIITLGYIYYFTRPKVKEHFN